MYGMTVYETKREKKRTIMWIGLKEIWQLAWWSDETRFDIFGSNRCQLRKAHMHLSGPVSGHLSFVFVFLNISQRHNFQVLSLFAINSFLVLSLLLLSYTRPVSSFVCWFFFFPSLMVQRYCFYPCQTVLYLTCFIVSTKEMGTIIIMCVCNRLLESERHGTGSRVGSFF